MSLSALDASANHSPQHRRIFRHLSTTAASSAQQPDYFDVLRTTVALNESLSAIAVSSTNKSVVDALLERMNISSGEEVSASVRSDSNSSIYEVSIAGHDGSSSSSSTIYRLAEIKTFVAFSSGTSPIPANANEAFAVLLAMHHFNNMQSNKTHPVLGDYLAQNPHMLDCNVKLTMELFDSQYSPTRTTQEFTSVVRQQQQRASLQSPRVAAVIGAQRSTETLPLAILTAVHRIPQVSASATAASFDDKEQFGLFGRTVTSTKGEAAAAARYFQSIQSTHIAILFVTDSFGSALQKAMRDEANKVDIATESFAYGSLATDEELSILMASLQRSLIRHVYAICFEEQLVPILNAAVKAEAIGSDFLYIFPSLDKSSLEDVLHIQHGSPISRALNGTGLLHMQGGITTETLVHGAQAAPLFNEESTAGFDRFRVSWRDALNDQPFVDYVRSKLPASLDDIPNFNRSLDFASEPTGFVNFNYDAVTGLGLAMCRAGENETFFGGDDIYAHFRQLDFEGASGNVRISPETGTRNYTTIAFALWNIRIPDAANADGYSIVEFVPSVQFRNDAWSAIPGNEFVFADGSTVAPLSLPPVPFNFNYIGSTSRAVGYTLMSLVLSAVLASIGWTIYHNDHVVVDSAQPVFLIVVSVGAFTMALAIIPLAFEETVTSNELILNTACMAVPWLYFIGTSVALSALLVKTEAVHKAFLDPDLDSVQITAGRIFKYASVLVSFNVVVLLVWYFVSPMEWTRIPSRDTDSFNRLLESSAVCRSDNSLGFAAALIVGNLGFLVLGTVWAFKSRNVSTEYNESHYLGTCVAALLQAWLFGIPVLVVVRSNPAASFFVKCGLILVTSGLIVGLVYGPKVIEKRKLDLTAFNPREMYRNWKRHMYTDNSRPFDEPDNNESTVPSTQSPTSNSVSPRTHVREQSRDIANNAKQSDTGGKQETKDKVLIGGIEFSLERLKRMENQVEDDSSSSEDCVARTEMMDVVRAAMGSGPQSRNNTSSGDEGRSRDSEISVGSLWKIAEDDVDNSDAGFEDSGADGGLSPLPD